jgi:hypothetical protein
VHHREEILAHEASAHGLRIGTRHGRVVRGDEQRADRRGFHREQRLAEP